MTDREALLVAYGALKALDGPTRELYDHLFGDKPSESEITHSTYSLPGEGTYKTSVGCVSTFTEPTMPGEYRLKRSWLEAVSARENLRRSPLAPAQINLLKTHCPNGHEYSGDNIKIRANGSRDCGACATEESRKYNDKNREAKNARRRVRRANGKAN